MIVRSKVNKTKSACSLYLQRVNARLFVKKRTRTSSLTCSRSSFYLWCTHTKKHSHKIQREQNGESCGVCARVEKERENAKGRGQRTDRQRDRESKKCGRKSRNLRVKSVHIEERKRRSQKLNNWSARQRKVCGKTKLAIQPTKPMRTNANASYIH